MGQIEGTTSNEQRSKRIDTANPAGRLPNTLALKGRNRPSGLSSTLPTEGAEHGFKDVVRI
jgi:hypothetical protein